jgi:choline kinase
MKEKQFTSYFEGAIQELVDQDKYDITVIDTKGRFWGEIDFLEDYERVKHDIPKELTEIAKKNLL